MNGLEARQFIVDQLTAHLAGSVPAKNFATHRGMFQDMDELKRFAKRSPSILVAIRGFQNAENDGSETLSDALCLVYVVTTDTRPNDRGDAAMALALAIKGYVAGNAAHWAFAEDAPQGLSALDLSSIAIDQNGLALWQVSWTLRCRLSETDPLAALVAWAGYDADHFKPGANTEDDQPIAQDKVNFP